MKSGISLKICGSGIFMTDPFRFVESVRRRAARQVESGGLEYGLKWTPHMNRNSCPFRPRIFTPEKHFSGLMSMLVNGLRCAETV